MSNTRPVRELNGGRFTRPRRFWRGKLRDRGSTYGGTGSVADIRRAERRSLARHGGEA
jgi:hypothetical protein